MPSSSSNPQIIHVFAHPAGERASGWEEAQQLVEATPEHFPILEVSKVMLDGTWSNLE